ncbi:hypothetical protein BJ742DRAFT_775430 [Cladochytrium replicatum]|nr:hypothetical protein BJ742DRAFT_775430 [Cladochytrium replicatum]
MFLRSVILDLGRPASSRRFFASVGSNPILRHIQFLVIDCSAGYANGIVDPQHIATSTSILKTVRAIQLRLDLDFLSEGTWVTRSRLFANILSQVSQNREINSLKFILNLTNWDPPARDAFAALSQALSMSLNSLRRLSFESSTTTAIVRNPTILSFSAALCRYAGSLTSLEWSFFGLFPLSNRYSKHPLEEFLSRATSLKELKLASSGSWTGFGQLFGLLSKLHITSLELKLCELGTDADYFTKDGSMLVDMERVQLIECDGSLTIMLLNRLPSVRSITISLSTTDQDLKQLVLTIFSKKHVNLVRILGTVGSPAKELYDMLVSLRVNSYLRIKWVPIEAY